MKAIENNNYQLLRQGIDASVKRGKVITNNIANANTKGYKKFRVTFEENVRSTDDIKMKRTREKHFDVNGNESTNDIRVERVTEGSMKSDGNNVDIDNEMVNLAANTLKYNAMVSEMNKVFRMTRAVIKGGE